MIFNIFLIIVWNSNILKMFSYEINIFLCFSKFSSGIIYFVYDFYYYRNEFYDFHKFHDSLVKFQDFDDCHDSQIDF